MIYFTKTLAFILLLIWGAITISIVGPLIICAWCKGNEWFCGARQLLEKILED